jgi:hypothetical protein
VRDQPVTQLNRVTERFHCQRALCDSRQAEEIGYRAERKNKMIVFEHVRVPIETMRHHDLFFVDVDLVHVATEEIHVSNHLADGIDDVRQIQVARRDLVQHRRKQEKVLAIYDRDFEARIPAFLKLQRRIKPAEASAKNEDTRLVAHCDHL